MYRKTINIFSVILVHVWALNCPFFYSVKMRALPHKAIWRQPTARYADLCKFITCVLTICSCTRSIIKHASSSMSANNTNAVPYLDSMTVLIQVAVALLMLSISLALVFTIVSKIAKLFDHLLYVAYLFYLLHSLPLTKVLNIKITFWFTNWGDQFE